jgi:hypothetical protein
MTPSWSSRPEARPPQPRRRDRPHGLPRARAVDAAVVPRGASARCSRPPSWPTTTARWWSLCSPHGVTSGAAARLSLPRPPRRAPPAPGRPLRRDRLEERRMTTADATRSDPPTLFEVQTPFSPVSPAEPSPFSRAPAGDRRPRKLVHRLERHGHVPPMKANLDQHSGRARRASAGGSTRGDAGIR